MRNLAGAVMNRLPPQLTRAISLLARPIFPTPGNEEPGLRVFRAPLFWEDNVCGVTVMVIPGALLFMVVAGIVILSGRSREALFGGAILIVNAVAGLLAYFPAKLGATYPYAAEVEIGKGLRLYTGLGRIYVPIGEVKEVKWSWPSAGWTINLKKRSRLLSRFTIHAVWVKQGRELAQAIERELMLPA